MRMSHLATTMAPLTPSISPVARAAGLELFGATRTTLIVSNNGNITPRRALRELHHYGGDHAAHRGVLRRRRHERRPPGRIESRLLRPRSQHAHLHGDVDAVGYQRPHRQAEQFSDPPIGAQVPGDFDIEFRYSQLQWPTGGGLGGLAPCLRTPLLAGNRTDFFELAESGDQERHARRSIAANARRPRPLHFSGPQRCGYPTAVHHRVPVPTGSGLRDITAGPDGNPVHGVERQQHRADHAGRPGHRVPFAGSRQWGLGITAGPDGNLWFTEQAKMSDSAASPLAGTFLPSSHHHSGSRRQPVVH